MDKKNIFIGGLLMIAAFGLMLYQGKTSNKAKPEDSAASKPELTRKETLLSDASKNTLIPSDSTPISCENGLLQVVKPILKPTPQHTETLYTLENQGIKVRFTSRGGAIKDVSLKNYPITRESEDPFVFNAYNSKAALSLSFATINGDQQEYTPIFKVISMSEDRILFASETREGVQIFRGYSLSTNPQQTDPYVISHETRFNNNTPNTFNLKKIYINLGSLPPTRGDTLGEYLNVGYFNGKDSEFIKSTRFKDSKGFFGLGKRSAVPYVEESVSPLVWGAVKNQFFASVLTPKKPGTGIVATTVDLGLAGGQPELKDGLTGSLEMELGQLSPGEEKLLGMQFYVGPKEFTRLDALGSGQDQLMQFGFFGFISKFLLVVMNAVNQFIPNWGLTIIVVTILIKLILWPLTAIQVRSSKRMAKLQGPLKEIKAKYKNNPQKSQQETMKLFKAHRVNPAAGCLSLLVQLPIFLGLYFMLRTSSELRFASFLWIPDLSLPDTVAHIASFPLNILPLIMGASMFLQMRTTPTPTTDAAQQKIFQLMPFIFLVFCYNFPSGLVLYWTAQNIMTIIQQYITNRMKDPLDYLALATSKSKSHSRNKKSSSKKWR